MDVGGERDRGLGLYNEDREQPNGMGQYRRGSRQNWLQTGQAWQSCDCTDSATETSWTGAAEDGTPLAYSAPYNPNPAKTPLPTAHSP